MISSRPKNPGFRPSGTMNMPGVVLGCTDEGDSELNCSSLKPSSISSEFLTAATAFSSVRSVATLQRYQR